MKITTMRHRELLRLIERLRAEQSKLERHAKSLPSNDQTRWRGLLDDLDQVVERICVNVSHEGPQGGAEGDEEVTNNPMTLNELRNWHYRRKALADIGKPLSDMPWAEQHWDDAHCLAAERLQQHPFPPTLDGAASAMPEGWWWTRDVGATANPQGLLLKWSAMQIGADRWGVVTAPDTGNEIYDRYLLAKLAHEKESAK